MKWVLGCTRGNWARPNVVGDAKRSPSDCDWDGDWIRVCCFDFGAIAGGLVTTLMRAIRLYLA